MGYPTKVQQIQRKNAADQYYINCPTAVAEALEVQKGEIIEKSQQTRGIFYRLVR